MFNRWKRKPNQILSNHLKNDIPPLEWRRDAIAFFIPLRPTYKHTPTEELKLSLSRTWSIARKYKRYLIRFFSVVDFEIASAILQHKTWPSKWYARSCYFCLMYTKQICSPVFAVECLRCSVLLGAFDRICGKHR